MKNLLYVLVFLSLAVALVGECETVAERVAELQAAEDVEAVFTVGGVVPYAEIGEVRWGTQQLEYWSLSGSVLVSNKIALWVKEVEGEAQVAYYARVLPEPLRVPPVETYITARSTPYTAAQVGLFVNNTWVEYKEGQTPSYTPKPIREFSVANVDGSTVVVAGYFNVAAGVWEHQEWYVHLKNPHLADPTVPSNVEIERKGEVVVEAAP